MTTALGSLARVAAGKESDWGSGVAVTDLIPALSESIEASYDYNYRETLVGDGGRRKGTFTGRSIMGGLTVEAIYDLIAGDPYGIELFILAALGTCTRDAVNDSNQYTVADQIDEHLTVCINDQVSLREYISAMVRGFTFTLSQNENGQFDFDLIAKEEYKTGDAGITNAIADLAALDPTSMLVTPLRFDDATFRIADVANVLASGDAVGISSVTISFRRSLTDAQFTTASSSRTIRPRENAAREVTLSFDIPRYDSTTFLAWRDNKTELQADLKFTSGTYQFNFHLPCVEILTLGKPLSGPGLYMQTVNCTCSMRTTTNTYMKFIDASTTVDDEIGIECKSARTAVL
ncbi:MAG: phage tail tube protein [bacterium]